MTSSTTREPRERILSPAYAATTIGLFSLIAFAAFESMAVTTIMPTVARSLDGFDYYALSFAAPFASGVVGMVAAGMWADRRGPLQPLLASLVTFSAGLLVCGTAATMEVFVLGRIVQGLGGGLLTVVAYVLVGLVYPQRLQPAIFAAFAAAWVLPALFRTGRGGLRRRHRGLAVGVPRDRRPRRGRRRPGHPDGTPPARARAARRGDVGAPGLVAARGRRGARARTWGPAPA